MEYIAAWQLPATGLSRLGHARARPMVRCCMQLHQGDGSATWRIDACDAKGDSFKVGESQTFTGPGAARAVVERYLQWVADHPQAAPLFSTDALALFPSDHLAPAGRQKTPVEVRLDEAMLWIEAADFRAAQQVLDALGAALPDTLFRHTVQRRLNEQRAEASESADPAAAARYLAAAVQHAEAVVRHFEQLKQGNPLAEQHMAYHFGSGYRNAAAQMVAACCTQARYWLTRKPQEALHWAERGAATHYGTGELAAVHIRALIALGRAQDACPIYAMHAHAIGPLPELTATKAYRQYLEHAEAQAHADRQQRRASVATQYLDSAPLPGAELNRWRDCYPRLPEPFLAWLASGKRTRLEGRIDGQTHVYALLDLEQSQAKQAEMMDWLHLHLRSNPALHEAIWQAIQREGINPQHMAPIMSPEPSPNVLLLRCDGGDGEYGAVYFWAHDQMACFDRIANHVDEALPELEWRLQAGDPLSF